MGCGSSSTADTHNNQITTENSNGDRSNFIHDAVIAHNEFRDMHGCPHITLAKDLTDYAQKYAEHLAKIGKMEHSKCDLKGESIGENICTAQSSDKINLSTFEARFYVKMWYDEIKDYEYFGKNPNSKQVKSKVGHFTQLVWKGAKQVGVGVAIENNCRCIVVCNYRPAGNVIGYFANNVPSPL